MAATFRQVEKAGTSTRIPLYGGISISLPTVAFPSRKAGFIPKRVAGMRLYCCAMLSRVSPGATLWRRRRDSAGWHCVEPWDESLATRLLEVFAAKDAELACGDIGITKPSSIEGSSSQQRKIMLSKQKWRVRRVSVASEQVDKVYL